MNEIIQILIDFLCVGNSAYECQRFVAGYENPIVQLLWFAFFPIVFILLFTIELAGSVSAAGTKYKTLIGMGIIILIIIQGWWHIILWVSKIWWFSLLILGGLYVFTHKMGMKNDRGVSTQQSTGSQHWLRTALLGSQPLDPRIRAANQKLVRGRKELVSAQIKELEKERKLVGPREQAEIGRELANLRVVMEDLKRRERKGLPPPD